MESITLELRPRLRSCNVFISLHGNVEPSSIQLKLNENMIKLRIGNVVKDLHLSSVKILPKTLSLLRVSDNWISFRIQTQSGEPTFGSFKAEFVGVCNTQNEHKNGNFGSETESRLKQRLCKLCCSRCKNEISTSVSFERVLPLPDSDCDPSEWFCCKHDGSDFSKVLSPGKTDCFYGNCYRLLHRSILKTELKIDNEAVSCNRCLSVLGTLEKDDASVKVWNCCVEYKLACESILADEASSPLSDFAILVRDYEASFTSNKLLMESSDGSHTHYLLLQTMDKCLDLLVEPTTVPDVGSVQLQPKKVTKVLYKYGETETEVAGTCEEMRRCQVAPPVMLTGVEHLLLTTKRFPPAYRVADKFCVGYVDFSTP